MSGRRFVTVGAFLICLAALAAGGISLGGASGAPQDAGRLKRVKEVKEVPTPVEDGVMTAKQKEHSKLYKSARYPRGRRIPERVESEGHLTVWGGISEVPLSNLPLGESLTRLRCAADAVVIGSVRGKSSNLTEGGTFVFTDYDVAVDDVLKSDARAPVESGDAITVTRPGGTVSIRGRVVRAIDREVERLEVGQKYLLYLRRVPATGAYGQVSHPMFADAFLLSDDRVEQISDKPLPLRYLRAADAAQFLAEARNALHTPCVGGASQ